MDGNFLKRLVFLLPLFLFAAGCGSPVKSSTKGGAPSFNGTNGGGNANPSVGDTPSDSAGFFLRLTSAEADITLHQADDSYANLANVGTTNFSEECKVETDDLSTASESNILCIAEIEELDLFFSAITLQYHVPPSMCSYVSYIPYSFYGLEPGTGPTAVSYETQADGTIVDRSTLAGGRTDAGAAVCDYDYTLSAGFNCCEGKYSLTHTDNSVNPATTTTTTGNDWGGDVSNCLFNSVAWTAKNTQNFPVREVRYVDSVGFNSSLTISSAIGQGTGLSSNGWAANYYDPDDHTDTAGVGSVPAGENANRPVPFRIPETVTGVNAYFPSDSYDFICYNRAQEQKARIRLMIRDWNIDNIAEGNDPNAAADPSFPGDTANDRYDWKDFDDANILYPASYL